MREGRLCKKRNTKQEFTTADSPEYSNVAERGLLIIESVALAAKIYASDLCPGFSVPSGSSLWAEGMIWAGDAYNCTATVANAGHRSPHEMFYREPSKTSPISFLKPGYCKCKRMNNMDIKVREYFYLSSGSNHPSELDD